MSDPEGGTLLCHNDPCLENIAFDHGQATALIDFDLAVPGRPIWGLTALAFCIGPTLDPESAADTGFADKDTPGRLRLLPDAYGMSETDHEIPTATVRHRPRNTHASVESEEH